MMSLLARESKGKLRQYGSLETTGDFYLNSLNEW
ncbi:hypothetical protein BH20VER3_BH20VER3_00230 [soil metagenome]